MNGKRLFHNNKIKYLGVNLDETLSGFEHCEEVSKKLSRANGILAKARHYVSLNHLKNIYYATFSSHLYYGCQVWGQSSQTIIDKISLLQRKSVRIMTNSDFNAHTDPLFKNLKILKVKDNLFLQNCLFVHDFFHDNVPNSLTDIFNNVNDTHSIITRSATDGLLYKSNYNMDLTLYIIISALNHGMNC